MKAYKATFKHGHFIDAETGKNLNFKPNSEFTISAPDDSFMVADPKLVVTEPLDSESKRLQLVQKHGGENIIELLEAGQILIFRIGNSKRVEGDESSSYLFQCILLEDLYLTKIKARTTSEPVDWRLSSCICELTACLYGDIKIAEQIRGTSLSNLFSRTVQYYFANQRSTAINAFKDFYPEFMNEIPPQPEIALFNAANHLYHSLDVLRNERVDDWQQMMWNKYAADERMFEDRE